MVPGKQPLGNVSVSKTSDLRKGLLLYWVAPFISRNLATNHALTIGGQPTTSINSNSNRIVTFDSTSEWVTGNLPLSINSTQMSILVKCSWSYVERNPLLSKDGRFILWDERSSAGSLCLTYWHSNGTVYNYTFNSATVGNSGTYGVIVSEGSTTKCYKDGVDIYSSGNAWFSQSRADNPVYIGNHTGGSYTLNGTMEFACVWDRALCSAELESLYLDPYQLLIPA
jgi:hypothetical protein